MMELLGYFLTVILFVHGYLHENYIFLFFSLMFFTVTATLGVVKMFIPKKEEEDGESSV